MGYDNFSSDENVGGFQTLPLFVEISPALIDRKLKVVTSLDGLTFFRTSNKKAKPKGFAAR